MIVAMTKDDSTQVEVKGDIRTLLNEFYEISLGIIEGFTISKDMLVGVINSIPEEEEDSDD